MVAKCCGCFDLKFGYFTYAILIVGLRLTTLGFLFFFLKYSCGIDIETCSHNLSIFGKLTGWCLTGVLYCFLAIAGIITERSVMMYPCIVMLITELVMTTIMYLFISIVATPYILIVMLTSCCVYGYDLCCLISLSKKIQKAEYTCIVFSDSNETEL